ncbi:MAG: sigma-54 dependent transcriptional regulator [Gammaproteobacteria bacterium]|nr:sigma-54 dependent transcriptional regulator [Gammaproteobacteria bacterium]MBU3999505.1 sigma-54 dependent transcriptional regulator [Gammaproteobacteria bacterium]MBU4082245.1 sigma-54 dependent transcriptional regulator [Gammaproteobacteria bacterium]MBU4171807.1 sigma-54 dependent transcriptional regulator [Gammaproteobacteria bacterium]
MTHKNLLLIEDDLILGESLVQRFELEGIKVVWLRRLAEAQLQIDNPWGAVVSDVRLPDGLATDWFAQLPAPIRLLPWFFLTGYGSVNDAVGALQAGAREYLTKPFDTEKLVSAVMSAVSVHLEMPTTVLGISPAMRRVEELVHKLSKQKTSVLINGESGVGKEVVAQMIHNLDMRSKKGAFVPVNCAAVPESMMEAEFFGYEKGAFTGSQRAHKGFIERADGGTLFLDEVGDLPASMQAKLLRVLQERCFFRLGSERTTHSDFRIIAATNRDLYADMQAGKFREDLFYRLAVIRIEIPALRERPEDIRWLTELILQQITAEQGTPIAMSEVFLRDVMARNWRGNVRELRAYLEHAVLLSDGGILAEPITSGLAARDGDSLVTTPPGTLPQLHAVVEDAERGHIRKTLVFCHGNLGKTAETLGVSRKTLWEKMKRLQISA